MFLAIFEQRLKDEFIQKCFSDIRDSDRCRPYKEIIIVFGYESYVNCTIQRDVRVCFTKLRLIHINFWLSTQHGLKQKFHTHNAHVHSVIVII